MLARWPVAVPASKVVSSLPLPSQFIAKLHMQGSFLSKSGGSTAPSNWDKGFGRTTISFSSLQSYILRALTHLWSLSPPGGKLQKPQSEPGSVPGQHEAAPHDRGLQVEHQTDCPLGPGQTLGCQQEGGEGQLPISELLSL